jgi:serine protease Do
MEPGFLHQEQAMNRLSKGVVGVAVLAGLIAVGTAFHLRPLSSASAAAAAPAPLVTPTAVSTPVAQLPDFATIVRQYGPAVVNVSTTMSTTPVMDGSPLGQLGPDYPFGPFLRRFGVPQPQGETPARGLGSGFGRAARFRWLSAVAR